MTLTWFGDTQLPAFVGVGMPQAAFAPVHTDRTYLLVSPVVGVTGGELRPFTGGVERKRAGIDNSTPTGLAPWSPPV